MHGLWPEQGEVGWTLTDSPVVFVAVWGESGVPSVFKERQDAVGAQETAAESSCHQARVMEERQGSPTRHEKPIVLRLFVSSFIHIHRVSACGFLAVREPLYMYIYTYTRWGACQSAAIVLDSQCGLCFRSSSPHDK